MKDIWEKLPVFKQVLNMAPKEIKKAPCQDVVIEGDAVDLASIPVQTCWPGDAAPLITWGLVITRGPEKERQNLGIYRQQVIARDLPRPPSRRVTPLPLRRIGPMPTPWPRLIRRGRLTPRRSRSTILRCTASYTTHASRRW